MSETINGLSRKSFLKVVTVGAIGLVSLGSGTLLSGCSTDSTDTTDNNGGSTESGAQKIVVGTGSGYKPYCYLDDDGNLAGYEFEVLKAVNQLLPQYEFEFETFDFKNILLSLDSGKIDIGAHQFEENEDRVTNYLFGEVPYTTFIRYIVVVKDRNDIETIDDLAGKKVYASPGDNATATFETYNQEHPDNPINLDIIDGLSTDELIAGITSGKWDAYSATKRDVEARNSEYGDVIKTVGDPILTSNTYFVFKKGNVELQQAVDGVLETLKGSGELSQISIDVIGGDYTESE